MLDIAAALRSFASGSLAGEGCRYAQSQRNRTAEHSTQPRDQSAASALQRLHHRLGE